MNRIKNDYPEVLSQMTMGAVQGTYGPDATLQYALQRVGVGVGDVVWCGVV